MIGGQVLPCELLVVVSNVVVPDNLLLEVDLQSLNNHLFQDPHAYLKVLQGGFHLFLQGQSDYRLIV